MATLSAEETAEYAKLSPDVHAVLELALPGGTKRYVTSGAPLSSDSLGHFEGKVSAWPDIRISLADALQSWETAVDVEDVDRTLDPILYGSGARSVRGSTFTIRIASANIPQAKWTVRAGGRIADFVGAGQFKWRFILRSNDAALQAGVVPVDVISQFDFPNIGDAKLYGTPIPIVYGLFDSRDGTLPGNGPVGSLPGYYVDNTAGAQLVLLGQPDLFHCERIFFDGTVQSSANWTRVTYTMPGFQPTRSTAPFLGRRMSFAKFTASGPSATTSITWDGYGICRTGLGVTGTQPYALTNPVDQLQHLLWNYVLPLSPYRDGEFAASDPANLLDTTSWAAARAWCALRGYRGSLFIGTVTDGLSLLNEFAASHGMRLGWTLTGKLMLKPRDPSTFTIYYDTPWLRAHEPDVNPIIPTRDQAAIISELSAESFQVPAQGGARNVITVGDYSPQQQRVSQRVTSRAAQLLTRSGSRRVWAAGYARFLRDLLDSPKGVYFADATTTGDIYDGIAIGTWSDIKNGAPKYDLTQATGANKPTLKVGAVAARPSLIYDGVNDSMSGTTMSNLISASGFHIVCALKATANGGASGTASTNQCWFSDSGANIGLGQHFTGGQNYLEAFVNDGGLKVASVPISLNVWYVVSMGLLNGTLYVATNLYSPGSIACGNVASLAGTLQVGENPAANAWVTGELFCLVIQNDTDVAKQGSLAGVWGGGYFHYTHERIADMLRIPESVYL